MLNSGTKLSIIRQRCHVKEKLLAPVFHFSDNP